MATNTAFWSVFRRSRVPMFVLDDEAIYLDANAAACTAVGLTRDDFVGRRLGFGADERRQDDVARLWAAFRRRGHLVMPYQYTTGDRTVRMDIVCTAHTPEPNRHLSMYWTHPAETGGLSPREREITQLLTRGLTGAQIAELLHLSPETVRTHIHNEMKGVGAHTRSHLVARAIERGLVVPTT
jgi:DNA-binding CsgD family transcriptional regulator